MNINIVLTGANGRMGRTIHNLLVQDKFFNIAGLVVHVSELEAAGAYFGSPVSANLEESLSDVANPVIIDFTSPDASLAFARIAAKTGTRHVIGTTGLNDLQKSELADLAEKTPIFWSPNMSVGINVLLKFLPDLAQAFGQEYDVEIMEIHHKKKKDSPSGTALRLGEVLAQAKGWSMENSACYHREGITGERPQRQIGMQTLRGGDVVGVHTVYFMGPGERIELTHQAHSRENFAGGALRAARWIADKPAGKLYSMQDVLQSA